jgi:hypothetical protein
MRRITVHSRQNGARSLRFDAIKDRRPDTARTHGAPTPPLMGLARVERPLNAGVWCDYGTKKFFGRMGVFIECCEHIEVLAAQAHELLSTGQDADDVLDSLVDLYDVATAEKQQAYSRVVPTAEDTFWRSMWSSWVKGGGVGHGRW